MHSIGPEEFEKGLWKNGRGVSWNIAAEASLYGADFGWRLAIAEIAGNGPFSHYDAVDRVFTLLDGDGISLNVGNEPHEVQRLEPRVFACDVPTDCTLKGGPCRALNLFTARGEWTAAAKIVPIDEIEDIPTASGTCLLFALAGEFAVATAGTAILVAQGGAAVIETSGMSLSIASRNGLIYVAQLARAG